MPRTTNEIIEHILGNFRYREHLRVRTKSHVKVLVFRPARPLSIEYGDVQTPDVGPESACDSPDYPDYVMKRSPAKASATASRALKSNFFRLSN
jgi:hypothetical protein